MPDLPPGTRCVAHPARLASDLCPSCDRPRCGADGGGPTCQVCHGLTTVLVVRPPGLLERLVRGALGAFALALPAGLVASQYVGTPTLLQYLAPAVVGVACGAAATAAAGEPTGRELTRVRQVALVYTVLAVAIGIRLEGSYGVFELDAAVLVPYAVALLACWLWSAPPKRRRKASS